MRPQHNGCGAGQLPGCKVRGYTDLLPDVPSECAAYAGQSGKELCVTHAGGIALNQSNGGNITVTISPNQATAYWAQLIAVAVFETGTQTRVTNGQIVNVDIRGASQFASQNVPLIGFTPEMPFLGVAWDVADATNPITLTLAVRSTGNVDVTVFSTGYGIR